ncbi:SMP-30/gluconolactonase/LRE family protein [Mucilaginibacter rubeus]|uniref:SMP-30/gluconolactonase/LRE family protein n=1 Tax=Mucilaginibacter rubeus TaxID=2027860 RepID=A0A5C1I2G2_9SPHI|nr:SMP-30/gluconolactonase/LRE family protein [Mucilaginibacter rubeus]QEM11986.1 SMP-30/gluconolactonase/LRE family protein [Mucilaginibacter rubeus]
MSTIIDATVALKVNAKLGEGSIWSVENQKLYWVDIEGRCLNVFNPVTGENKVFDVGRRIGTVVPVTKDTVLTALEDGLATVNLENGAVDYILNTEIHKEHNKRFNDGKCDPHGRFWVGTLSMDGVSNVSSLYSVDNGLDLKEQVSQVSISNGIAWNADGSKMYYIDTPTGEIVQYDFDSKHGNISNRKLILKIAEENGYPDGMTIDSEGLLWVALWDGFGVIRVDPSTGNILQKINIPAPKVTSCAFGGPNLDQLYITSASVEMSTGELEQYPLSGSIFVADLDVAGVPANYFKFLN